MIVSLIVAVSENNVIGKNNNLAWHMPNDMAFFKETTKGHHVLMGNKTRKSIPQRFCPLPERQNIVVSRNPSLQLSGAKVVSSIEAGIKIGVKNQETEFFIIGGGEIFTLALENNLVDKIYLTQVHGSVGGDVFFPPLDYSKWEIVSKKDCFKDEKHKYDYSFLTLNKKG